MSLAPEEALISAVIAAAGAAPAVTAVLGAPLRLYGEAPPEPIYPYATLGEPQSTPRDASESAALEHAITIHVWSRHGGRPEASAAVAALRDALHNQPLSLIGRRLVYLYATFSDVFRAGDGRTTHAVLRLKALTEPTPA